MQACNIAEGARCNSTAASTFGSRILSSIVAACAPASRHAGAEQTNGADVRSRPMVTTDDSAEIVASASELVLQSGRRTFELRTATSTISGGGTGVFLHGRASRGNAVSLYPGFYKPPPPIWAVQSESAWGSPSPYSNELSMDDGEYCIMCRLVCAYACARALALVCVMAHCIMCSDSALGGYINGRNAASIQGVTANPFAVGQLVNHPPAGVRPNVTPFSFQWPDSLARARLPNAAHGGVWYVDPISNEPVRLSRDTAVPLLGMILVALRPIVDEELFLDYGLTPPYPRWYSPVSAAVSQRHTLRSLRIDNVPSR
jgi:hypothetical protein